MFSPLVLRRHHPVSGSTPDEQRNADDNGGKQQATAKLTITRRQSCTPAPSLGNSTPTNWKSMRTESSKPLRPAYPPQIKPLDANRAQIARNIHAIAARLYGTGFFSMSMSWRGSISTRAANSFRFIRLFPRIRRIHHPKWICLPLLSVVMPILYMPVFIA